MDNFEDWIKKKERRRSRIRDSKNGKQGITRKVSNKRKRRSKDGFKTEVREAAYQRSGGKCENPLCGRILHSLGGEHHCLPRSFYKREDRNDLWNCAKICNECHVRVTSPTSREDVRLRRYFERIAWARRTYSESRARSECKILQEKLINGTLELIRVFTM